MPTDVKELAVNALRCLDIGGRSHSGNELAVIYDGNNPFKTQLAEAIFAEAAERGIATLLRDVDELSRIHKTHEEILTALAANTKFETFNPLERKAVVLVPPTAFYKSFRGKITREILLGQKAYVLSFPFVERETAGALLAIDPKEVEGTAVAMKADLDRATHVRFTTDGNNVLEYAVNPALKWVPSVGLIKKYSPRDAEGQPKGGWGNPPGEIFTSFAHSDADYTEMNGFIDFSVFTLGAGLPRGEHFTTRIVHGAVDRDRFGVANEGRLNASLIEQVNAEFGKEKYADHLGELGIGLVRGVDLTRLRDTVVLEKIGGTFHVGFGYDENDRGTGGFVNISTHNDCGTRGMLEARIDGAWKTVLFPDGTSPYFTAD